MTELQMGKKQAVTDDGGMTADDWQIVEAIAQDIVTSGTDVNELKKVVAYLCWLRNRRETIGHEQLFEYLATLARSGEVRSKQTPLYYQQLEQICRQHLQDTVVDGDKLLNILGWAGRACQGRTRGR